MKIPGYQVISTFINRLNKTEAASENFNPIIVVFDGYEQLCFEIEKVSNSRTFLLISISMRKWQIQMIYVLA